jgi:hypothetical protein
MTAVTHPTKEAVRHYLQERAHALTPPGTPVEIRRQLGWWLLPQNIPSGSRRD